MHLQLPDRSTDNKEEPELALKIDSNRVEADEPLQLEYEEPQLEENTFKPWVFLKFTLLFLMAQLLGPLCSLIVFKLMEHGYILAHNLHIFGGWREIIRTILWLLKIYCFVITYTIGLIDSNIGDQNTFESRSQFWMVIYTDIALSVLYGAYYSSFTKREIQKLETETYEPGDHIVAKLVNLINTGTKKAFNKEVLAAQIPELDLGNLYFVYSQNNQDYIPAEMISAISKGTKECLKRIHISNAIIIEGETYGLYIFDKAFSNSNLKHGVFLIQVISRILVLIRVLLPVAQNVTKLISFRYDYEAEALVLYIIQQIFYCYFIAKFAEIYDVLFLGLLLYIRKLKILRFLQQLVDMRPHTTQNELLKIETTVPQNIENWLNLRKIFAGMNQQAFLVIDINTSFTLLYTAFFAIFYALYAVNLLSEALAALGNFLVENTFLQAAIFFTILIVVFVLIVHLVIGIMINLLFVKERRAWTLQRDIVKSIRINYGVNQDWKQVDYQGSNQRDEYVEKLNSISSILGPNLKDNFDTFLERLKDSILLVLDGLNYEENINPHTILGIKTTPRLAISVVTLMSAVGITTINDIINQAVM